LMLLLRSAIQPASNHPVERTAHSAGFWGCSRHFSCGPPLTGSVRRRDEFGPNPDACCSLIYNMIAEYELYSDERLHTNSTAKHLVLGGVICTDTGRDRLREALSNVRAAFSLSHEMRWAKVSSAFLNAYKAWMGVFFDDQYARFSLFHVD